MNASCWHQTTETGLTLKQVKQSNSKKMTTLVCKQTHKLRVLLQRFHEVGGNTQMSKLIWCCMNLQQHTTVLTYRSYNWIYSRRLFSKSGCCWGKLLCVCFFCTNNLKKERRVAVWVSASLLCRQRRFLSCHDDSRYEEFCNKLTHQSVDANSPVQGFLISFHFSGRELLITV